MREYTFGEYIVLVDSAATRELYSRRKPHLLRCACPGCQNFFKAIAPYVDELEAYLSSLGADLKKPDEINPLWGAGGKVVYDVSYGFVGTRKKAPKTWLKKKTPLGKICLLNPKAVLTIDDGIWLRFAKSKGGNAVLKLHAELPWLMETLGCIYDPSAETALKIPTRAERIYNAVKKIKKQREMRYNGN